MRNVKLEHLNNLTADDIREFLVWLEDYELDGQRHHNDRAGKKRKLSAVRRLYDYLTAEHDFIQNNPAIKVNEQAVFISSVHHRMTTRSIERTIQKYAEKALGTSSGVTPHTLRKTFGTQYYEVTRDILATADVLGHALILPQLLQCHCLDSNFTFACFLKKATP